MATRSSFIGGGREELEQISSGRRGPTPVRDLPDVIDGVVAPQGRAPVVKRRARSLLAVLDAVGIVTGMAVGLGLLGAWSASGTEESGRHVGVWVLLFVPIYLLTFIAYGLYSRDRRRLFATSFPDAVFLAHALLAGAVVSLAISHLLGRVIGLGPRLSLTGVAAVTLPALVSVPAARVVGGAVIRHHGIVRSRVVILGSGTVADSVARRLAAFDDIELLGCVDDVGMYGDGGRGVTSIGLLGHIDQLPAICVELNADRVIVAFSPTAAPELADTLRLLASHIQVSVVPRLFDLVTWRSRVEELHGLPVMDVAPPVLGPAHRAVKRAMDLVVSLTVVVAALPVWVAVALMIKLTSPGPVLFRQQRCGRGGRPFSICKFRTMRQGADAEKTDLQGANEVDGPLFKIKDDPRVTRVGKVLRATSLDELPQLLNVVKGDMSLVGPRPFVIPESELIEGWATRRFDVRPGMTGLWQVSGRNDLPFEELRRLDYAYVASWSLWWDLKIISQTPSSVLHRRGAY